MPVVITEDWTRRSFTPGDSAQRYFDITGAADYAEALAELSTQHGVAEATAFPIAAGEPISVPAGGIEFSQNGRITVASVRYARGAGGGTFLDRKWQCTQTFLEERERSPFDGVGQLITNSNSEPIGVDFEHVDTIVQLRMWRYETGADIIAKQFAYARKWNSEPVTFPKIGTAAAGEALLLGIESQDEFSNDSINLRVYYTFWLRPKISACKPTGPAGVMEDVHNFRLRVADIGFNSNSAHGPLPIVHKLGMNATRPVTRPVMLDGRGAFVDTTSYNLYWYDEPNMVSVPPESLPNGVVHYLTGPAGTTLLYDLTRGPADLNDLDIAANV